MVHLVFTLEKAARMLCFTADLKCCILECPSSTQTHWKHFQLMPATIERLFFFSHNSVDWLYTLHKKWVKGDRNESMCPTHDSCTFRLKTLEGPKCHNVILAAETGIVCGCTLFILKCTTAMFWQWFGFVTGHLNDVENKLKSGCTCSTQYVNI